MRYGLLRSFLAIELPESILRRIGEVQRDLKSSRADVRWVSPQNIHLTLKFFGNIEESKIDSIAQSIEEPARTFSPIGITVRGMGAFPGLKSPRVIWIGLHDEKKVLVSFQKQLDGELQKIGFQPEDRPFHPHLTLGRMRSNRGKDELVTEMEKYREEEFGSFQTDRVILLKSDLRPEGPIYTPLREIRLGS
jgi:2'-5' RNA ligase